MSGLLESIARRRRASASRRLGPPANGIAPAPPGDAPEPAQPPGASQLNGAGPAAETETAPGASPASPESRPSPAAEAESGPSPAAEAEGFEPEQHSETELTRPASDAGDGPDSAEAAAQPEAVAEPEPEPEAVPQPEPEAGLPASAPTFLERGRIRRRARYLRRLREIQLRDIGGFMLELQRFGRDRPDLVQAKLAGAASTDRELRVLERALGEPVPVRQLREAGIGGACSHCGAVYSSVDRFCSWCGTALSQNDEQPTQSADPDAPPSAL